MSSTDESSLTKEDTVESEREGSGYMLGVILCLADSIVNIVQIALKQHFSDINNNHLIVSCGKNVPSPVFVPGSIVVSHIMIKYNPSLDSILMFR